MLSMRQVARTAFRLGAAMEPAPPAEGDGPRTLLDPRHLVRASLLTARFGSELLDSLWKGPEAAIGYTEFDNKVRAFHFFESEVAHLESHAAPTLADAIRSACDRLGDEQAVWASEGIGYEIFERQRKKGSSGVGLLTGQGEGVPGGSWTVLHTGMGMALAEAWLDQVSSSATSGQLHGLLTNHVQLCTDAARPGYADLAFEPLGLVTRLLRPELVQPISEQLERMGPPWSDLFWHGVGRGLYFLPANLSPGRSAPWAGLDMCREEATHESGRRNALTGFSWAITLVNLRHPGVVENFLSLHGEADISGGPVTQGVLSALLLWHETTGGSKELRRFIAHVAAPARRPMWQRLVRGPFEETVRASTLPAAPDDGRRVAALFRYRPPGESGAQ